MGLFATVMTLDAALSSLVASLILCGGLGRHPRIVARLGAGHFPEAREADKICFVVLSSMSDHFVCVRADVIALLAVKVRGLA